MLSVDNYAQIRQARRAGLSIRAIAARFGHSTKTVLKALAHSEPKSYTLATPRPAPVFDAVRSLVDDILTHDQTASPKQRHTAAPIVRRLVAEHNYAGSDDPIQRYLQQRGLDRRETFIPLAHPPGHRAEADFGHIYVDFPEGRRQVPVLVVTWSYSNCPFATALHTERTEAILHGLVEAFAFFGCVPRELWWDNPKTVAIHILKGRERILHSRYAALASHYTFVPRACMVATPTEKPRVEKRLPDLQRQWATPVPRATGLIDLNAHLVRQCLSARERTCGDNVVSVSVAFAHDRAAALPVTARRFDPCVSHPGQVDKYQTVPFDRNRYSVPRRWAFRVATVKGYVERIEVVGDGTAVAAHPRSYRRREKDPPPLPGHVGAQADGARPRPGLPRLATAECVRPVAGRPRRPARVGYRHAALHPRLVLANYSIACVGSVIAECVARDELDVAVITAAVRHRRPENVPPPSDNALSLPLASVTVRPTDLAPFDRLLSHSPEDGDADERRDHTGAVEGQSEATEVANHARRVGEARP